VTALELLAFSVLAILTNTVIPVPFEPVLLAYSAGAGDRVWPLALLGSACAGIAAVIDAGIMRAVRSGLDPRSGTRPRAGVGFHAIVVACALLPLPFVLVRASLIRARPRVAGYAVAVAVGRLPRYVVTLWAGSWLLPESLGAGLTVTVLVTGVVALAVWRRTPQAETRADGQAGAGIPR